jgi:outer membrane protein OmpA-like peptidoglycan-associated protein
VNKILLVLIAVLSACSSVPRPILLDDEDRHPAREHNAEEERRAQEALREIERRVATGNLPKIQFEFDSDEITGESYPTLDLIASLLMNNPRLKLFALAHTDSVGTAEYNLDLSERRARSVKAYLVSRGVAPPSIRFKGMGYTRPLEDNSTDEGRAKNRRVEFRVTTRDWNAVY